MLRRKLSRIKLDLEDLAEYIEVKKQSKEQTADKEGPQNTTFELSESLPIQNRAANAETRQAQVRMRIGFSPDPVTPEATLQYSNIH